MGTTAQIELPFSSHDNAPAYPHCRAATDCQQGCLSVRAVRGMSLPREGSLAGQELRPCQKMGGCGATAREVRRQWEGRAYHRRAPRPSSLGEVYRTRHDGSNINRKGEAINIIV
jgi:hypothetical protein